MPVLTTHRYKLAIDTQCQSACAGYLFLGFFAAWSVSLTVASFETVPAR